MRILGETAREILRRAPRTALRPAAYLTTETAEMEKAALLWLAEVGDIATSDLMVMTGVSRGTAKSRLDDMAAREIIVAVGAGRATRYRLSKGGNPPRNREVPRNC
ncbi:Fic family protein [Corynebacterium vitaeruminis]|uniref:hypothetical protein n=1 Tax=Corynebacterium vitaeruminis TaxID=38305 RepID=UPI00384D6166